MNGRPVQILLRVILALCFAVFPAVSAVAQGFAGLGAAAEGFTQPSRDIPVSFPRDHGPHPDFRIEWWYLTANLQDADGTKYGLQWTLFRSAMAPEEKDGWASPQIWMGHAAVTTPTAHYVAERLARGGIGQAGARADPFSAWIDDWEMTATGDGIDALELRARGTDFGYDMTLSATGPIVLQGDRGYSVKSTGGRASYYYSQPFYEISGTLRLPERDVTVTGTAWLDREWASQPLGDTQISWDWFSMVFDGGERLMGFTLHDSETGDFTAATWIASDGTPTPYPNGAFQSRPLETAQVAGRDVPVVWQVLLPDKGIDVTVRALNPQAWMDTSVSYWEGPVTITGSHPGRGYLEMTGY
ncbi:lipocalin-like domain-containing protein [uncultured Roseobacter sp.]|uniref:lipocalin-like domain-containing protein n=1 Tax=uncultured Roseobacter sp. TaxID=114847 RepID=UPI0026061C03|nr:lipocalin-like domain-containing protein [uncultured Roseobacter sp.]